MRTHYQIEIAKNAKNLLYIPAEVQGDAIQRVAYGTLAVELHGIAHPKGKNILVISEDIAVKLRLPNLKTPLHLFMHEHTLYLGPLVGIFTSGFTPFPLRPIGERSLFFSKLLSVEKLVGAHAFVFGEEHINWENGTIEGLFYLESGWQKITVPFPNVIYDRLPNRRSEKKESNLSVKERLQKEYLIPWYNPGFFNKMDVYERLQQDPASAVYLPETHPFTSFSMIESMLADYGHVFIKPINGSLGFGIHQIIFDRESQAYFCRYRERNGENKLRKYQTLEALFKHIFKNRSLSHMLVQQGIHSLRVNKQTVDFRIHTNKDNEGNWQITAIAAKVASPGSVTTHINNGGMIKTMQEIFHSPEQEKEAVKKLKKACLTLSHALETYMEGIIGEIGFDMGIDRDGNVWLFEANSKPGRSIFKHPHLKAFDLLTRRLSLDFSIFLTEQTIVNPEEVFK
ncbi:YheC/YheD family protein [Robertmurraya sp. DFI.2.37]|uniref:YheC/YheD family endospore coat-associated protein n=1 Tax=Robertmurraya sp. DFI.2.37 TaxID=3031819 RepID=UPI001248E707|nr:YheC/YheD family protein [Robertmurraya sp. DFI.2.37]MDF1509271.1 YheC/YheD family protein [Robertmurraya sp. DFI.2.37]